MRKLSAIIALLLILLGTYGPGAGVVFAEPTPRSSADTNPTPGDGYVPQTGAPRTPINQADEAYGVDNAPRGDESYGADNDPSVPGSGAQGTDRTTADGERSTDGRPQDAQNGNVELQFSCPGILGVLPDACDLVKLLFDIFVGIGGFAVWLTGGLLNFTLSITVVQMADYIDGLAVNGNAAQNPINITWGVIRDLANMAFIFIVLYIGIRKILGLDDTEVKKLLIRIIVAAVLINFSLFITKFVVDVSNVAALQFYRAITCSGQQVCQDTGLGTQLMDRMKLNTILSPGGQAQTAVSQRLSPAERSQATLAKFGYLNMLLIGFMGMLLMLTASFVFLMVSFLFIIRFVIIIILLIISPIAFAGMLLPGLQKYSDEWRQTLLGQAMFAPIYMVLTWISLFIFASLPFINGTWAGASSGDQASTSAIFLGFLIVIIFLVASLVIARQVSSMGGAHASQFIGGAKKFLGNATFGAGGWIGRRTGGLYARKKLEKLQKDDSFQERLKNGDLTARMQFKALSGIASGSFDARGIAGGRAGKYMDLGEAKGKGGFDSVVKKREETFTKMAANIHGKTWINEKAQALHAEHLVGKEQLTSRLARVNEQLSGMEPDNPDRGGLETERLRLQSNISANEAAIHDLENDPAYRQDRAEVFLRESTGKMGWTPLGRALNHLAGKAAGDKKFKQPEEKRKIEQERYALQDRLKEIEKARQVNTQERAKLVEDRGFSTGDDDYKMYTDKINALKVQDEGLAAAAEETKDRLKNVENRKRTTEERNNLREAVREGTTAAGGAGAAPAASAGAAAGGAH